MIDEDVAAEMFTALSNADRLRIIRALVVAGPEGLSAGEIAETVGASPSRASFHLATLSKAGHVESTRHARNQLYTINFETLGGLMAYLLEDCCGGSGELKRCSRRK